MTALVDPGRVMADVGGASVVVGGASVVVVGSVVGGGASVVVGGASVVVVGEASVVVGMVSVVVGRGSVVVGGASVVVGGASVVVQGGASVPISSPSQVNAPVLFPVGPHPQETLLPREQVISTPSGNAEPSKPESISVNGHPSSMLPASTESWGERTGSKKI